MGLRRLDWIARRRHWDRKVADLALFAGFVLALQPGLSGRLVLTGCLGVAACVGLAVFGYAWNDFCDAETDVRAGKRRPGREESRLVALVALFFALVSFAAAASVSAAPRALALALAFAAATLAWAYSAPPLRLKERGSFGLLAGAVAQRTLPAVFLAAAFDAPVRDVVPWLIWMTCWGLRGMVIHQLEDAETDRLGGLGTWGVAPSAPKTSRRLLAVLVPLEAASFVVALLPLLEHTGVLVAAIATLAAWLIVTAAFVSRLPGRLVRVEWLSFGYVPLADLYGAFAPVVVATALLRLDVWPALVWIAFDAALRAPVLRKTWAKHVGSWSETRRLRLGPQPP